MMLEWFAVAVGGLLGSTARHGLTQVFAVSGQGMLPIATLSANVVGCFLIGVLAHWSRHAGTTDVWWVVGARVGLLGGLTTFSSFGLDVVRCWIDSRSFASAALVVAHVGLGLAAVALGMAVSRSWITEAGV